MSKSTKLRGGRSVFIWLLILLVFLAVGLVSYFFAVLGPQQQIREQGALTAAVEAISLRITEEAQADVTAAALQNEQAELERQYAAALVFQETGDWQAAADSLREVIRRDAGYKEAAQRLDAVLARLGEEAASATAVVAGETATARARAIAHLKDFAEIG